MTAGTIKIDKRLPYFFGGRAGIVKFDRLRALVRHVLGGLKPDFNRSAAIPYFSGPLICPGCGDLNSTNTLSMPYLGLL
jgi:hypothetical protein